MKITIPEMRAQMRRAMARARAADRKNDAWAAEWSLAAARLVKRRIKWAEAHEGWWEADVTDEGRPS